MAFSKTAYAIYDQMGHLRSSGIWMSQAAATAAATALGDATVRPILISDLPDPLTVATGAAAGSPGHFTPRGATVPAAITGIVADPVSAWTVGQYVALATSTDHAYWTGTAWAVGEAPV